ncbi:MAG: hypothetical protein SH809_01590 [Rhodothermales bacterium]|nr:hypothetical protein [Rhodothermales bacterium]
MKTCIDCASRDTAQLAVRKDAIFLSLEWVCVPHLLVRIERLNCLYPGLDYDARIRPEPALPPTPPAAT